MTGKYSSVSITLYYINALTNFRYFALEKRCENLRNHLAKNSEYIKKINSEAKVSKNISLPLKDLGVYGLLGHTKDGGQGLCYTEACKVIEELSCNMSLSESVVGANTYGVLGIQLCGTKAVKDKYLPRLMSGEQVGYG